MYTSPNWADNLRPHLNDTGKSQVIAIWSPSWEKGPRWCIRTMGETSNRSSAYKQKQGLLLIIPACKLILLIVFHMKMQLWLFFNFYMLFISTCES